jgi:hypothetical protein
MPNEVNVISLNFPPSLCGHVKKKKTIFSHHPSTSFQLLNAQTNVFVVGVLKDGLSPLVYLRFFFKFIYLNLKIIIFIFIKKNTIIIDVWPKRKTNN